MTLSFTDKSGDPVLPEPLHSLAPDHLHDLAVHVLLNLGWWVASCCQSVIVDGGVGAAQDEYLVDQFGWDKGRCVSLQDHGFILISGFFKDLLQPFLNLSKRRLILLL